MKVDYESIKYFNKVAEKLSFVQAANELNIQKSLLSRHIAELEKQLGVRLFHRTTRRVALTEEGQTFFQEIRDGVHIFDQAIESVQSTQSTPHGTVRISTPVELGLYLLEHVMPGFLEAYPLVKIEWDFSSEKRNLLQNRLDLVIRAGRPLEDSLVIRKIGKASFRAFASPELKIPNLENCSINIIEQLPWILFEPHNKKAGNKIKIKKEGREFEFSPNKIASYQVNNITAVRTLIMQGIGIGFLPRLIFENEVEAGTIKELVPRIELQTDTELFLVFPSKSHISPKTRALSEWILSRIKLD
ncbi:LysR family transcriptional regulator [Legionella sp. WA2022007384]